MPFETQGIKSDSIPEINKENRKILDALDVTDPSGEQLRKIVDQLNTTEILNQLQEITKLTVYNSALVISNNGGPKTERERLILQLQAKLFPVEALNMKLEQTNKPSNSIAGLINSNGSLDENKLKELMKKTPEELKELFKIINKGDLISIFRGIDTVKDTSINKETIQSVAQYSLDAMVKNGLSLEKVEDITFIEKYGSLLLKAYITTLDATTLTNIKTEIGKGNKYVLKSTNDTTYSIQPLKDALSLPAGIDLLKLNTINTKEAANNLVNNPPKGFNLSGLKDMLERFSNSGNKFLKMISDFFNILFGGSNEKTQVKPLDAKGKRDLLGKMKNNPNYDLVTFFNKGTLTVNKQDPKFQLYLADVDKLLGPGLLKKDTEGKTYIYDETILTAKITEYQNSLKMTPATGKLDADSLKTMFERLNAEGKVIDVPQSAPAPRAPAAPEKVPEAPKKHEFADLFGEMRGKTTKDLLSDKVLLTKIQTKIGDGTKVKQFQIDLGMKLNDPIIAKRPDGKIGLETVNAYFEKYENGFIKPEPAKK